MSTLLLRLAGPLQSWGTQSRFRVRDTGLEPSKSGVIGLLCAALGRPRHAAVDDLAALRMGVRVDREGVLSVDYHTAGGTHGVGQSYGVAIVGGKNTRPSESWRYYLAGADFLVGFEGDRDLLQRLDRALREPVWPLFLGRKAFVPGEPVRLPDESPLGPGLRDGALLDELSRYPWPTWGDSSAERLRFVFDADRERGGDVRRDVPVSFAERGFATRYVMTEWRSRPEEV
ncbi:MAG: type I-E CRISPR-associated protein Cas5/CasD [Chloroflexi bacterium]|nr:type I-E CRISPR-associated protein Cas5/CasD [Chloroflexota bacterium]